MAERKAVTKEMLKRYPKASRVEKGRILDELCALTGWTRRHARRALATAAQGTIDRPRRPRERIYGPEVLTSLCRVWAVLDGPSGKRLAPFMAEIVEALERCGELDVTPTVRDKLLGISSATIDRMLVAERRRLKVKGRSGTKPGSMLKRQIPIRTFAEWNEDRPGFCEVDLVGHDGGVPAGEFCQTLDLTCVKTGWTEPRALKTKSQRWVREALEDIERDLPFPLLGIDCDNGGEFINVELFTWCEARKITFTRSRPYRKNDNCFVEQKNWPVVRQQVGYLRYDNAEELECLRELYGHLRLYINFFQPQMKLASKVREGSKVTKRYDIARTPYRRVLALPEVPQEVKDALTETYRSLNPAELKRAIGRCQDGLIAMAKTKTETRKEVSRPPDNPYRRTMSWRQASRTSLVMQPVHASRTP
ncbi:MAG: integrase [Actinobacteria bacterium]|nr:integrase [Actinomycetota bacterium]